jgi:hypothetical protein
MHVNRNNYISFVAVVGGGRKDLGNKRVHGTLSRSELYTNYHRQKESKFCNKRGNFSKKYLAFSSNLVIFASRYSAKPARTDIFQIE